MPSKTQMTAITAFSETYVTLLNTFIDHAWMKELGNQPLDVSGRLFFACSSVVDGGT